MRWDKVVKTSILLILAGGIIFFNDWILFQKTKGLVLNSFRPLMSLASVSRNILGLSSPDLSPEETTSLLQSEIETLKKENESLKKALDFSEENKLSSKGANVLLYVKELGGEYLITDQGEKAGVKERDLVLDENGVLVGRIVETGDTFSKASVASNAGENLETEILPFKIPALSKGLGARVFSVELVTQDALVKTGDFVYFNLPGLKRLVLGEILSVDKNSSGTFQRIRAVHLAHPEKLSRVFLVAIPKP